MKILIVADVLGEPNNGTSRATYNLINALKERGHDVRVLCDDEDKKGVPNYFVLKKMNFLMFNNYVQKNGVALSKADTSIFEKAIEGVDVVHIMLPFISTCKFVSFANKRNIAISAGFHCQAENITSHFFLMWSKLATRFVYKLFWRHCYHNVDCIHYPTEFIKNDFEKIVGPTNAYVISNGVLKKFTRMPSEKPDELKDKFVIMMSGRYSREKRQDLLIKAMKYSRYADKIQIIFAGDGPQKKRLMRLSKRLKNQPIFGYHKQDELLKIINYCDLYVHTAYAELESISALEAISCGIVPVINKSKRSATKYFALDDLNLFKQNDPWLAFHILLCNPQRFRSAADRAGIKQGCKRFRTGDRPFPVIFRFIVHRQDNTRVQLFCRLLGRFRVYCIETAHGDHQHIRILQY